LTASSAPPRLTALPAGAAGAAGTAARALPVTTAGTRAGLARRCAELAAVAAGGGGLGLYLMQHLPATRALSPMSEPLSKYALTPAGWLFDLAVTVLALGVGGIVTALVLTRTVRVVSVPFTALSGCALGLVAIVIFPDYTNATGGLTTIGWLHWSASVAAFAGPPLAALLLARRHRLAGGSWPLAAARWLSVTAACCLTVYVAGAVLEWTTELPVWRIGGAVERGLTAAEIAIAITLAAWSRGRATVLGVRSAATGP
jgi:hypothetical protein